MAAWRLCALVLLAAVAGIAAMPDSHAASIQAGSSYWYVPEHEKYVRTEFYSEPDFGSSQVRISRAQRFSVVDVRRGWAMLEFDSGARAFVHARLLNSALHDPAATDPWYEFRRASVFAEEPAKIEARLRSPDPQTSGSKTPVWKRYKDSWGLNKGRSPAVDSSEGSAITGEMPEKKARRKYPLLPPIGSQPQPQNPQSRDPTADDPERAAPSR